MMTRHLFVALVGARCWWPVAAGTTTRAARQTRAAPPARRVEAGWAVPAPAVRRRAEAAMPEAAQAPGVLRGRAAPGLAALVGPRAAGARLAAEARVAAGRAAVEDVQAGDAERRRNIWRRRHRSLRDGLFSFADSSAVPGKCVNRNNDIANCGSCEAQSARAIPPTATMAAAACPDAIREPVVVPSKLVAAVSAARRARSVVWFRAAPPAIPSAWHQTTARARLGAPPVPALRPNTPIATPSVVRPIFRAAAGRSLVYSVHRQAVIAVPVKAVNRTPVTVSWCSVFVWRPGWCWRSGPPSRGRWEDAGHLDHRPAHRRRAGSVDRADPLRASLHLRHPPGFRDGNVLRRRCSDRQHIVPVDQLDCAIALTALQSHERPNAIGCSQLRDAVSIRE